MLFDQARRFARPRRARRTGLISLPGTFSIDLDHGYPEARHLSLDEWLALPPEQQVPPEALALYEVARGKVRIALIDTQTRTLHSLIRGHRHGLVQFKAVLAQRASEADEHAAAEAAPSALLADVKNGGTEPPTGPRVAATDTDTDTDVTRAA